ncbi:MAG: FliG C-terminal domain-containing protein [Pseudomonadota bacterium]
MTDLAPAEPTTLPMVLTGPERAAIILSLLEPDVARSIAERFDVGRTERAITAFENLPMVGRNDLMAVIDSYLDALDGDIPLVAGGQLRASELARALEPPMMDFASPFTDDAPAQGSLDDDADAEAVWTYVRALDPEKLGALLISERASIISAVVQQLERDSASAVLAALPVEKAGDVARMMIAGRKPSAQTYDAIAESLRRSAPGRLAEGGGATGFVPEHVAGIFNRLPAAQQEAILEPIRPDMPEEMAALDEHLLNFPNLEARLPKTIVPTLFREMDKDILDAALGHALKHKPHVAEFLLSSISQRLAEQIRERIAERPPQSDADGENAQAEIMKRLIAWEEEGRFAFKLLDSAVS